MTATPKTLDSAAATASLPETTVDDGSAPHSGQALEETGVAVALTPSRERGETALRLGPTTPLRLDPHGVTRVTTGEDADGQEGYFAGHAGLLCLMTQLAAAFAGAGQSPGHAKAAEIAATGGRRIKTTTPGQDRHTRRVRAWGF